MIIENADALNNPEAIEAISQLPNIARLRILDVIKHGQTVSVSRGFEIDYGGKSGAAIVYVEAEPDENAKWSAGNYYIKVNPSERDEINKERVKRLEGLQNTAPQSVVDLVELVVHKKSLVEMTGSALKSASASHKARRLTDLLKTHTHLTQRYIRGVAEILFDWSKESTVTFYDLEQIFLAMFEGGRLRQHRTRKIDQRARILFKQLRLQDPPEDEDDLPIKKLERLSSASKLIFGDYNSVPNPIAYINNPQWWQSVRQIPFRTGFSHQDLHSDNIICDLSPNSEADVLLPDIIDLTDYKPLHSIFWDFLYLEFDLLIRVGRPERLENREELWRLVANLMEGDLDNPIPYDGPFLFQSIFDCVQILRQKIREHIEYFDDIDDISGRPERYQLAFWVIATGVGLNYMRKSSVHVFRRLLGLFYAAHAFKHVVEIGRLEEVVNNQDTLTIPSWELLTQKLIPTEVDGYINDALSPDLDKENPIVICLSPDFNPVDEDTLKDEIQSRLVWWMSQKDAQKSRNISESMAEYVKNTSNLNLGTLIRRLSHARKSAVTDLHLDMERLSDTEREALQKQILLEQLAELCESLPNLTIVTTAWYEPLFLEPNSDNNFEPHSVIYLCGHTDVPKSLCTLRDWTEEPSNPFLLRQYERVRALLFDERTRFIFLGSQPMDEIGWQFIFDAIEEADYIDTIAPSFRLPGNIEPYRFAPEEFIAQFHETYHSKESKQAQEAPKKPLNKYMPSSIIHSNLQEEIVHHEARLWIVNDIAWKGKTTFLHNLCKQHAKWYHSSTVRKGLLIDFDEHPNLRAQKRAIVALLLDHYHANYPSLNKELWLTESEKLSHLLKSLNKPSIFKDYNDELLLCFDGLPQDDPYLLDWLREELAPKLADYGITVVFALRTFDTSSPMNLAEWEQPYEFRSLEWIQPSEVKSQIINYVKKVEWGEKYAQLDCNLENWSFRQALTYQHMGRGRMMIVDKLFREHMAQEKLDLGQWPQNEQKRKVEQKIVFETIWDCIETELGLEKLSADPPRWSINDPKTIVMTPGVRTIYRELLMCRRISGEFIYRWSTYRKIRLPKFLPTMLSELQSLAYIQYDDRPLQMRASRAACKHPIYFVSDTIYTTMQRHFYYEECQDKSPELVEQSTLFQLSKMAYFYFKELAEQAEAHKLGGLLVGYAGDVIYYASVLYALDHNAAKPKTELRSYLQKLKKLDIAKQELEDELKAIHLSWQIDKVRDVLKLVIELI